MYILKARRRIDDKSEQQDLLGGGGVFPQIEGMHACFYFFGFFGVKSGLFELLQPPLLRESIKQNGNHAVLLLGTFDIGMLILSLEAIFF